MSSKSLFIQYIATIKQHRYLLWQLVLREFNLRYSGSFLGLFWSFFTPLLLLAIYTFVFNTVLGTKWGTGYTSDAHFALVLFAGLIMHGLFSDCAYRAPTLIQAHSSYVKRVVFPLEILPLVLVINSFLHACMSMLVLGIFYAIVNHAIAPTIVFVPFIILPFLIFNVGIVMFLSLLGVYIKDIAQAIGVVMTITMFTTPIFYPMSAVSSKLQWILYLNPLTFPIEQMRNYTVFNTLPHWPGLGIYFCVSLVVFYLAYASFQKARKGFADVL